MPTTSDLGRAIKTKYPGQYDDLDDGALGRAMQQKFQGQYDDFVDAPSPAKAPTPYGLQQGRSLSETLRNENIPPPSMGISADERDSMTRGALDLTGQGNSMGTRIRGARDVAAPFVAGAATLMGLPRGGGGAPPPIDPVNPIRPAPGISATQPSATPGILRPLPAGLRVASKIIPGGKTAANLYDAARAGQGFPDVAANSSAPIPQVQGSTALPGQFTQGSRLPQQFPPGSPRAGTIRGLPDTGPGTAPPPQGSTANPAQYGRGLPPRAIPPGGPQTGTVPGTVAQPPAPQGSTANPGQFTQNAPPAPTGPVQTGTIRGTVMPPQFPPKQPPVGSLPLNPPQAEPQAPPQGPALKPGQVALDPTSRGAAVQAANDAKVGALQNTLIKQMRAGKVTVDQLTSDPAWQPHGAGGAGQAWKDLADTAGVRSRFTNAPDNSPNQVLQKLGITRQAPQAQAPVGAPNPSAAPVKDIEWQMRYGDAEQPDVAKYLGHK
jgi:hypothetical protein